MAIDRFTTGVPLPASSCISRGWIGSLISLYWTVTQLKYALTFLLFADNPAHGTIASGVLTLIFAFPLVFAFLCIPPEERNSLCWPWSAKLILVFVIWCGITLLWTHASSRAAVFGYWADLALNCWIVFAAFRLGDIEDVVRLSVKGYVIGTLGLAMIALLFRPTLDVRAGLGNDFMHPNHIGNQFAIAGLLCLYLLTMSRQRQMIFWICSLAVLVFSLISTLSKTAIFAFLIAVVLYLLLAGLSTAKKLLLVGAVLAVVVLSFSTLSDNIVDYFDDADGNPAETLTGRTIIWSFAIDSIQERPVLGSGFMSFKDEYPQTSETLLPHAHNEWLQLWYSLGLVGLLIGIFIYVSYFSLLRRFKKRFRRSVERGMSLALLAYALIRGLTEASVTDLVLPISFLLLLSFWAGHRLGEASSLAVGVQ